jgi:hypothetical protein
VTADTDVVEGEVREVEEEAVPERGLAVSAPRTSVIVGGTAALAAMSEAEFDKNLASLKLVRERIDKVKLNLMKDGVDYGPPFAGSKKDTLLKPGTETLLRAFGLADSYVIDRHVGHTDEEPELDIVAHARIHIGDTAGPIIAEGVGEANTWEVKHRRRKGERICPECGQPTVIKGKDEYGGGWLCYRRKGGCGAKWGDGDPAIEGQSLEPTDNPDPWDLANTIVKMAKKRALVDGVLTATGSSGLFSQDEDAPGGSGTGGTGASTTPSGAPQGAAGTSGQPRQSGPSGAPGASDEVLPAGVIQAVVSEAPDNSVRMVKSGHTVKRWEGDRAKLELVTKVGNRKHTGMLLGPLAEAAAIAQIKVGEVVRFVGAVVEEIVWQEDKPKKKEVWGTPEAGYLMTDLLVMRDGQWWSVNSAMPTLLPAADATTSTPPSTAPTTSTSASTSSPASTTAPLDPTEDPSTPPGSTTRSGTPSTATTPGATQIGAEAPTRMIGAVGTFGAFAGVLLDPIVFTIKGTTPVAIMRVAEKESGEIISAALGEDIEGQVGTEAAPFINPGEYIGLYGEWKAGGWLVVQTVGRKGPA